MESLHGLYTRVRYPPGRKGAKPVVTQAGVLRYASQRYIFRTILKQVPGAGV